MTEFRQTGGTAYRVYWSRIQWCKQAVVILLHGADNVYGSVLFYELPPFKEPTIALLTAWTAASISKRRKTSISGTRSDEMSRKSLYRGAWWTSSQPSLPRDAGVSNDRRRYGSTITADIRWTHVKIRNNDLKVEQSEIMKEAKAAAVLRTTSSGLRCPYYPTRPVYSMAGIFMECAHICRVFFLLQRRHRTYQHIGKERWKNSSLKGNAAIAPQWAIL